MAGADSTVRVNIVGDARRLQSAAKDSEKAVGRFGSSAAKVGAVVAGAFAVGQVVDFAQSALSEADRLGDATARLEEQLGDLSQPLIDAAGRFEDLGLSAQDTLELEARIADIGTAAGIADEKLAPMAVSAAEAAGALSLITDRDAATILDDIGKAAAGSDKPLKNLGISLSDAEVEARAMQDTGKKNAEALTDGELAAARLAVILEKLLPRVQDVTSGEADLEQQQRTLNAKFETFTAQVGDALDGPLTDFLTWLMDIGDQTNDAIGQLKRVEGAFDNVEGAAGDAVDTVRELLAILARLASVTPTGGTLGFVSGVIGSGSGGSRPSNNPPHPGITVQVQGGSPEVIEQAVKNAIRSANGHGPLE